MEMQQYTCTLNDGNHEDQPRDSKVGVSIRNLTKIYSKVHHVQENDSVNSNSALLSSVVHRFESHMS